MVINWYGEGCFKIQSGQLTMLTDPFGPETGITPPRFKADVVLYTKQELGRSGDATNEITGPGEYELKDVEITGWQTGAEEKSLRAAYLLKIDGMRLALFGHLEKAPEMSLLENIGAPDILIIPAGGAPFISQEAAAKLVKQMNPKIVLASFFKIPGLKRKADGVSEFLKELGQEKTAKGGGEPAEKLMVKKKDLPQRTEVVVLTI
jgi:L-ascorbate metabolism protein UlaG (beta-lactamase superfamily)